MSMCRCRDCAELKPHKVGSSGKVYYRCGKKNKVVLPGTYCSDVTESKSAARWAKKAPGRALDGSSGPEGTSERYGMYNSPKEGDNA